MKVELDNDVNIKFTLFENQYNTTPIGNLEGKYSDLLTLLSTPKIGRKNSNNSLVGGTVTPTRNNDNVKNRSLITLDFDDIPKYIDHLFEHIQSTWEYAFAMYSTHNHTEFEHRFRVIIPLDKPYEVDSHQYKQLVREVVKMMDCEFIDPASLGISLVMHLPTIAHGDQEFFFDYVDEEIFNPTDIIENIPAETKFERVAPSEWLDLLDGSGEGGRNIALSRLSGHLLSNGIHPDVAWKLCECWNMTNSPPLDDKEFETTFNSILRSHLREKAKFEYRKEDAPVVTRRRKRHSS